MSFKKTGFSALDELIAYYENLGVSSKLLEEMADIASVRPHRIGKEAEELEHNLSTRLTKLILQAEGRKDVRDLDYNLEAAWGNTIEDAIRLEM